MKIKKLFSSIPSLSSHSEWKTIRNIKLQKMSAISLKTDCRDAESVSAIRKLIAECGDELIKEDEKIYDDETLLIPIRCRKYDIPSAFERLKRVAYARKVKYPETFNQLYPSLLKIQAEQGISGTIRRRDHKGRNIVYIKISNWDPSKVSLEDVLKMTALIGFEMGKTIETQQNGSVVAVDMKGFSMRQARQVNPMICKKYVDIILHANPIKIKGIHILNAPRLFSMTWSLIKMFLPHKMGKRVWWWYNEQNLKEFHEHLSPEILPEWLGGSCPEEIAIDHQFKQDFFSGKRDEWYIRFMKNN